MASKVEKQDEGLHDLEILYPEAELTVAGRAITLREYTFVQGLKLRAKIQPFLNGLSKLTATPELTPLESILDLLADYQDSVLELMSVSANVEVEWIKRLNDEDGQLLAFTWWRVCGPFFVRQLQSRMLNELLLQLPPTALSSVGVTSMPPSSPTDTTLSGSESTPSAS